MLPLLSLAAASVTHSSSSFHAHKCQRYRQSLFIVSLHFLNMRVAQVDGATRWHFSACICFSFYLHDSATIHRAFNAPYDMPQNGLTQMVTSLDLPCTV